MGTFKRAASAAIVLVVASVLWVHTPETIHAQDASAPNSQPNPYRLVVNWARLPQGISWGAFDIDRDGNIYVLHRSEPAILKFSPSGQFLKGGARGSSCKRTA